MSLYAHAAPLVSWVAFANIAVLASLPLVWTLPLLETSALWIFGDTISIWSGAHAAYQSDLFLFGVLVLFAMIMPLAKSMLYVVVWFGSKPRPFLSKLGWTMAKLSMTDVFLIALMIITAKGLSLGRVAALPGFYIFASLVIAGIGISLVTQNELAKFNTKAAKG